MLGEVEGSRNAGLPRAKPKGSRLLRRDLPRLYSTHLPSRISSNSLKTNDGCHGYPSRNREDDFPGFRSLAAKIHSAFFATPIGSKLARGSSVQESRSRWLTHRLK